MLSDASRAHPGKKELGAFYTPAEMADKLVRWAVRAPEDRALDPSFGGMALVERAYERLLDLGTGPEEARAQIHGCELDRVAFRAAREGGLAVDGLMQGDFFEATPGDALPRVEAVVGNPPYVRYQVNGAVGALGRRVAREAGVSLTAMSSSWAPFAIHATAFVEDGGRMALILPAEFVHAQYAREVRNFLQRQFGKVTLVLFEKRVFPGVAEEVVFLLADHRGSGPAGSLEVIQYESLTDFDVDRLLDREVAPGGASTHASLLAQLLPEETRDLLTRIGAGGTAQTLGRYADVDIGTVTGANDYFLVREGSDQGIAPELLRPIVSRAAHLPGARFAPADYEGLVARGAKCRLLAMSSDTPIALRKTAATYLRRGEELGVSDRYKCRQRDHWWSVPIPGGDGCPDLFLTYCAAEHPRLVVNEAEVLHTNALHAVRLKPGSASARSLAAGFVNSLTLLSAELEGRSYGGGVLKLEPSEAESIVIPPLTGAARKLGAVDGRLREGDLSGALDIIDPVVLGDGLGLSECEIGLLRAGAEQLRARRRARRTGPLQAAA